MIKGLPVANRPPELAGEPVYYAPMVQQPDVPYVSPQREMAYKHQLTPYKPPPLGQEKGARKPRPQPPVFTRTRPFDQLDRQPTSKECSG